MNSICKICGRAYSGINCLKCTQASIAIQSFGEESLGLAPVANGPTVIAKTSANGKVAKLKLPDGQMFGVPRPTCRIGNDHTNDIVINDDSSTARFHAQISFDEAEQEYVLRDLGTKDGTYLNGQQVQLDQVIFGEDMIKIGKFKFYFISDLDS